jgi:hypothetical protein
MASSRRRQSRFDRAYRAGVVAEIPPPQLAPAVAMRELAVRAAPAEAIALQGCVLTPTRPVEDGHVVVGAGLGCRVVPSLRVFRICVGSLAIALYHPIGDLP